MPKTTLIVLKLGGSVVTAKDSKSGAVRQSLLKAIGRALATYHRSPSHRLVLLHGAGAPGHRLARKYDLIHGTRGNKKKKAAAVRGQRITSGLNASIMRVLKKSGLPVVTIKPPEIIRQRRGKLLSLRTKPITDVLSSGRVPVLYGDIVPDRTWGLSICSADISGAYLARTLRAERLLYATDTDGIFSDDPHHNSAATLIQATTQQKLKKTLTLFKRSHSHDVTGGMRGKIGSILAQSHGAYPKEIIIFNGLLPRRYSQALRGTLRRATKIKKSG